MSQRHVFKVKGNELTICMRVCLFKNVEHFKILCFKSPSSSLSGKTRHRQLQKRERTGKEYGCFPFV